MRHEVGFMPLDFLIQINLPDISPGIREKKFLLGFVIKP